MPRARMIKPHFPRSSSMLRVGRDARFLFVLLWTVADDEGRAPAAPAGLAAQLYPADPDVPMLLPAWLSELEREGCIERYNVDDVAYLRVVHWHTHQTIQHPTPSSLPPSPNERPRDSRKFREASRKIHENGPESPQNQEFQGLPSEIHENSVETPTPSAGADQITADSVLRDLERIQRNSEAKGVYIPALRCVELKGRRIGLWAGRKEQGKEKEAAPQARSLTLDELHLADVSSDHTGTGT